MHRDLWDQFQNKLIQNLISYLIWLIGVIFF